MNKRLIEEAMFGSQVLAQDSADNSAATVTLEGEANVIKCISSIAAGFGAAVASKAVTITDGTTEVWRGYVTNEAFFPFPVPIKGTTGQDLVVALAASGTGGVSGYLSVVAFELGG